MMQIKNSISNIGKFCYNIRFYPVNIAALLRSYQLGIAK